MSEKQSIASIETIYPSPVFLFGPLLIAVALLAGGVARGGIQAAHSTPALILLGLTYLISRWYRHAHVVFGADEVILGDAQMAYCDIGAVTVDRGPRRTAVLCLKDRNDVVRLSISLHLYGTGLRRIATRLATSRPDMDDSLLSMNVGARIYGLWGLVGMISVMAAMEGANFF